MSAHCTCVYTVNARGKTPAQLVGLMNASAVPVDPGFLLLMGCTVLSDNTTAGGTSTTRTIVFTLTAAFKEKFPDTSDQRGPFWNMMTDLIEANAKSPVIAAAPVLS